MKKNSKDINTIGVFDSGLGGLTILNQLKKNLPNKKFIYFGDTAHLPYGNKSKNSIIKFCDKIVDFLIREGADMVIVACHSASSVALDFLKEKYSIPVIGVVDPSIDEAISKTEINSICILGTSTTIESHTYKLKITLKDNNIDVYEIACPLFVPIVEEGLENSKISELVVEKYLKPMQNIPIDVFILGCTHYPLLINKINKYISGYLYKEATIINTGFVIAKHIEQYISNDTSKGDNSITYFVSDVPYRFHELASNFLEFEVEEVHHIELK